MATLWKRMSEAFPYLWVRGYGEVGGDVFATWCLQLRDMSPEQIKRGYVALCRKHEQNPDGSYLPSLPQFRALCIPTPQDLGLPEARQAYLEAAKASRAPSQHEFSHPAVYAAGRATGWFDLGNLPESKSWPIFERNYAIAVRKALAGEDLGGEIPKALPEKSEVQTRISDEEASRRIAEMIASLNKPKTAEPKADEPIDDAGHMFAPLGETGEMVCTACGQLRRRKNQKCAAQMRATA